MNDFTFLTSDQAIRILNEYDSSCIPTDFAKLLGMNDGFADHISRRGWWTRSLVEEKSKNKVCIFNRFCKESGEAPNCGFVGARPAMPCMEIYLNESKNNNFFEVEYGEYPQTVASEDVSKILENNYLNGTLNKTGKTYTIYDAYRYNNINIIEYEYDGETYIRYSTISCEGEFSDGRPIEINKPYWIRVEPIKWIVDKKENIMVTKEIIFSNIPFNNTNEYNGDFKSTVIKKYMDEYFAKDIIPYYFQKSKELDSDELIDPIEKNKVEVNVQTAKTETSNIYKEKDENEQKGTYEISFDNVSEEEIIKGAMESDVAVFLHGRSSEGKSARVKQIDPDCIIIYLRNMSLEGLNGKSVYNQKTGQMIDIKPTWLQKLEEKCKREPDKLHAVFFDEITNALPSIQGMAFNIVLDKEVNGKWKLPENARIIAAGNDMEDSLSANQLAEPLFNRFAHVYIETTVESWLKWASKNNIHPAIIAFVAYEGESALRTEYNGKTPNADPRKWEMASRILYNSKNPSLLRSLLGETLTQKFCNFCSQKVVIVEDIINSENLDYKMKHSQIFATISSLVEVDEEYYYEVREFISSYDKCGYFCNLFDMMWAGGNKERIELVKSMQLGEGKKI